MRLDFEWDGVEGEIVVECTVNDDPEALGCPPEARGFPACTATIHLPAKGYRALLGWVQLVRSTDNASAGDRFETDPLLLLADSPSPYGWFGIAPTLFDAPFRPRDQDLTWVAHSFLAATPLAEAARTWTRPVVALAGFSWGFDVADGTIGLKSVERLTSDDWDAHLPLLREAYPTWDFRGATTAFR